MRKTGETLRRVRVAGVGVLFVSLLLGFGSAASNAADDVPAESTPAPTAEPTPTQDPVPTEDPGPSPAPVPSEFAPAG